MTVIAIDGPAAAGKGTLARRLAEELDFAYLDSGALYRAVAASCLAAGVDPADETAAARLAEALEPGDLEDLDLRGEATATAASMVAAHPKVRAALLAFQRAFAGRPPGGKAGAVLDGRDIGTVVCPEAELKFFVTASPAARAERRHQELIARGEESIYARVLEDIEARDRRDSTRAVAPLKAADDAKLLDTSEMTIEEVFQTAMEEVARSLSR
jgi:cytidylate kinase